MEIKNLNNKIYNEKFPNYVENIFFFYNLARISICSEFEREKLSGCWTKKTNLIVETK